MTSEGKIVTRCSESQSMRLIGYNQVFTRRKDKFNTGVVCLPPQKEEHCVG